MKRIFTMAWAMLYAGILFSHTSEEMIANGPICPDSLIVAYFSMEQCESVPGVSDYDYSDLTASYPMGSDCANFEIVGEHLYRNNPFLNRHSCTPGVEDGSVAMCISSAEDCDYIPGHSKTLKFDVKVTPENSQTASFSGLTFYEKAPEQFEWINGAIDDNNYPTKYGIRILVDGEEVFAQTDITTERDWNLECFDFSNNPAFNVTEMTIFNVELLPYCIAENWGKAAAWDIDNISILSCCNFCLADAGEIATDDNTDLCIGDGEDDFVDVMVTGDFGDFTAWVITDEAGVILANPSEPPFNFEGAGGGTCLIYHIKYSAIYDGIIVGNQINDLEGCLDISDPIIVNRTEVLGGEISTEDPTDICVGDGVNDLVNVVLIENTGDQSAYLITDLLGNILVFDAQMPFNFEGAGVGICQIWSVSWYGELEGASFGANIENIQGCFALSNPIIINRTEVAGGEISTDDPTTVCVTDGIADEVNVSVLFNLGANSAWLISDENGDIIVFDATPPFNFEGAGMGSCFIYHVAYESDFEGGQAGDNINDFSGCYSLSNSIEIVRQGVIAATISSNVSNICASDQNEAIVDVAISNFTGSNGQLVLSDVNGTILDLPESAPINLSGNDEECVIFHVAYSDIEGLEIGENLDGLTGCFALSNELIIEKDVVIGGEITTDVAQVCIGNGAEAIVNATVTGNEGDNSQWVVTDLDGVILGLPSTNEISFDGAGPGTCVIWHLSSEGTLMNVELGSNASDVEGCFSLSNPIEIERFCVAGGEISSSTPLDFCDRDQNMTVNLSLSNEKGDESTWVLLDPTNTIAALSSSNSIDLPNVLSETLFRIVNISYIQGISGLEEGESLDDVVGCYAVSNELEVVVRPADGGTISTDDNTTLCLGGINENTSVSVDIQGNTGTFSQWIITDEQGIILELPVGTSFDFGGAGPGVCLIWHLSYNGEIFGLEVGADAADIAGCADLSNAISVTRNCVDGGLIGTGQSLNLCADDLDNEYTFSVSDHKGETQQWIITNEANDIVALPSSNTFSIPVDESQYTVWSLSYIQPITGLSVGGNIGEVEGCLDPSNGVIISIVDVDGGEISTDGPTVLCLGDEDTNDSVDFQVAGHSGPESAWIITDADGQILGLPVAPPFDFTGAGDGECFVWHVSYEGILEGLEVGQLASDLMGCYDLSNAVSIIRNCVDGGTILGEEMVVCETSQGAEFDIDLEGNKGDNQYIITDVTGEIIAIFEDTPLHIPATGSGTSFDVWNVSYSELDGLELGGEISDISGCFDISNPLNLQRQCVNGGVLSTPNETFVCQNGNPSFITLSLMEEKGDASMFVVTNADGDIILLTNETAINAADFGDDPLYQIWNISYVDGLEGLSEGANVFEIEGCHEFSNPINIEVLAPDGGQLSLDNGDDQITICAGDCIPDELNVTLDDPYGPNMAWVILDDDGNILEIAAGPPFDFEDAGAGTCLIVHISYGDLTGFAVGSTIFDLEGCYDLSNSITVERIEAEGSGESYTYFNFNDCRALNEDLSNCDYSEFIPEISNAEDCGEMELVSGFIYRNDPSNFKHSCTPGVQATPAVCVSSLNSCNFENDSEYAVRFTLRLTPGVSGIANLSEMTFFERAPEEFEWLDGSSGNNNYPTLYGLRILANGTEIYKEIDIPTNADYTQQIFDFSNDPAFSVDEVTDFEFELLAYCLIGELAQATAWDIDDLELVSTCSNKMSGGSVFLDDGSQALTVCTDDGISDLTHLNTTNVSSDYVFIVTNEDDIILAALNGDEIEIEGAPAGLCKIWGLAYIGDLTIQQGESIHNLDLVSGCFALSKDYILIERLTGDDCGSISEPEPESSNEGDPLKELVYSFSPNPALNKIKLDVHTYPYTDIQVSIYSITGVRHKTFSIDVAGKKQHEIDITELLPGQYYLKVVSGNQTKMSKLTKVQ